MIDQQDQSRDFTFVLVENARILVMDDDPIQCEFARVYLSTPTATVETAWLKDAGASGPQLLKSARGLLAKYAPAAK